jgi:hypothetical protein
MRTGHRRRQARQIERQNRVLKNLQALTDVYVANATGRQLGGLTYRRRAFADLSFLALNRWSVCPDAPKRRGLSRLLPYAVTALAGGPRREIRQMCVEAGQRGERRSKARRRDH